MSEWNYYSDLFLKNITGSRVVDRSSLVGRCPVCGDSKVSKHKRRLYLMDAIGKYPVAVKCHNCSYSSSAENFFKTHFAETINGDELSKVSELARNTDRVKEKPRMSYDEVYRLELLRAKEKVGLFWERCCDDITTNELAYNYIKSRQVPDDYIEDMKVLKPEYCDKGFKYSYFSRYIFIPFIDMRDDSVYYFHARSFFDDPSSKLPRFLSCPYKQYYTDHKIYYYLNEHYIDLNKIVFVVEGTIDSLNIENSVCINGISKINDRLVEDFEERYGGSDNVVYVLDNEMIDAESRKKSTWLLRNNKKVFLWEELAKINPNVQSIKDINELCCLAGKSILPTQTILNCVKSSIVQKLERE